MRRCWDPSPDKRPEMDEVVRLLEAIDTSKGGGMVPDEMTKLLNMLMLLISNPRTLV
ncbi:hypothetical protein KFK09_019528 [Dendrobium nobile]|uniref:Serine-threonine/tyrosine-protein kinase catalytic domain-containing protein n=1 Tax=Dendrobium nobile TaxID=94219 RepID=A0A8T3ARC8_DENNO|nr:hypothetical protein KFK09_019528 [Dendrobium nobile]